VAGQPRAIPRETSRGDVRRLNPAGTGFDVYLDVRIEADEPPPPSPPTAGELEMQREMDDLTDAHTCSGTTARRQV